MKRPFRIFRAVTVAIALTPCIPHASGYEFGSWPPGASPTEVGQRVAARFAESPHGNVNTRPDRPLIYPEICAWFGALRFARASKDKALGDRLIARFEPLFGREANLVPAPNHVDNSVFGIVPLEIYVETNESRYLKLGLISADREFASPTPEELAALKPELRATAEQAVKAGLSWQTRFWVDDMYMITILQVQAFRATGDSRYLDRGAREAVAYLERLQQPNGLFHHAPDAPYFWGRGNGWFAVGMAEILSALPESHPQRARIMEGYKRMMAALLRYQDPSGMWRQLIDHPESYPETSCTGMFTFAFVTGVKSGWLDPEVFGPAAKKGWTALVGYIDANAAVSAVCVGTDKKNDLRYYLERKQITGDLHGQAPVLWCASALLP